MNVAADQPCPERDLLVAAITGDADTVSKLLQSGVKPDVTDIDGGTALQWASWYGHADVVCRLLAHGANVEARDKNGRRAIHEACEKGNLTVIILLIAADADIEAKDGFGFTALHRAALSHDAGAAHMLLDRGADITAEITPETLNKALEHGQTPFHVAIGSGNLAMAKLLIARGFDLSRFTLDQVSYLELIDRKTLREIDKVIEEGHRKQVKIHTVAELLL
jgi:ankyrin repeat protein